MSAASTEGKKMHATQEANNAPTLVAIVIAARRAGDRDLERYAKGRLRDQHGVKLSFAEPKSDKQREATADDR
jgi:hypothetical protein